MEQVLRAEAARIADVGIPVAAIEREAIAEAERRADIAVQVVVGVIGDDAW